MTVIYNSDSVITKVTKKIMVDSEWKDVSFYVIPYVVKSYDWLYRYYGSPIYTKTWWKTFHNIAMSEEIYLHWKLAEE